MTVEALFVLFLTALRPQLDQLDVVAIEVDFLTATLFPILSWLPPWKSDTVWLRVNLTSSFVA